MDEHELSPHEEDDQHDGPAEPVNYYPDHHELDENGELSLDMLKDSPPGVKPMYPFSTLIRCAIKGSPQGKLLLEDIYYSLEKRFEYFRTSPAGWKNTIRHTLSLHPSFEKVPRPLTDRGKGCYWTINEVIDPRSGVQRSRRRKDSKRSGRGRPASNTEGMDTYAFTPDGQYGFVGSPRPGQPAYGFTQFDSQGNAFPVPVPQNLRYVVEEDAYEPEIDATGQPDWHAIWKNELRRLRHATIEQMRAGAGPEWYKMMTDTVRGAFPYPILPTTADDQHSHQAQGQEIGDHPDQGTDEDGGDEDGLPLSQAHPPPPQAAMMAHNF